MSPVSKSPVASFEIPGTLATGHWRHSFSLTMNIPPNLNPSQLQAVQYKGKHLLIIAGPGTGKTHTLTFRIIETITKLKIDERILAITFTNKAADEMKARLYHQGCTNENIFVGTFHGFCLEILRQFIDATDLPKDFKVASPEEIEMLVKDFWKDNKKSEIADFLEEISHQKTQLVQKHLLGSSREIVSSVRHSEERQRRRISKTTEIRDPSRPPGAQDDVEVNKYVQEMNQNLSEYNRFLRAQGMIDFDDLLIGALRLLQANEKVRQHVQKMYPFIFVDEYQDINSVQHALLRVLVSGQSSLTAIGDPNQAIYGFRGADVKFFESFHEDFSSAQVLSLNENYRSTVNILKAAGQVIRKSSFIVPELTAHIYTQGRLTIYEAVTEKAEAEYVVHEIEKLIGGTSMFSQDSGRVERHAQGEYTFGDIAVLYRLNAQRHALEEALLRSGIPFQFAGDKLHPTEDGLSLNAEKVSLSTIHAAKGLEFSVVFIVGCEENILPLNLKGLDTNIEEERRLFYVGMTRAKQVLFLTSAKRRRLFGQLLNNGSSPFLADIEDQLKEYVKNNLRPIRKNDQAKQLELFG